MAKNKESSNVVREVKLDHAEIDFNDLLLFLPPRKMGKFMEMKNIIFTTLDTHKNRPFHTFKPSINFSLKEGEAARQSIAQSFVKRGIGEKWAIRWNSDKQVFVVFSRSEFAKKTQGAL